MTCEKGLPTDIDTERFVLGSILLDGELFDATRAVIEASDFSLEKHRRIFSCIAAMVEKGQAIDRITVAAALSDLGQLESCDGMTYLVSLDDGLPHIAHIESYVRRVREKSILRSTIFACQHVMNRCMTGESSEEILRAAEATVRQIAGLQTQDGPISTAELMAQEGISCLLEPRRHQGVQLPWKSLEKALCGLGPGQLVVLLAETSRGKTSMALQISASAAVQGFAPLIWTMEMSARSLFQRLVTQLSGAPSTHRQTTFEQRDAQRIAMAQLSDYPIYFDRHSRSVSGFVASLRKTHAKFAVVDYLQLIRGTGSRASRAQEVSDNSRALKCAAMDLQIPILALSQVDRSSVKDGGEIGIHSGKESGDIENDADVLLWIKAGELSRDLPTTVSLHIGKQREGPAGFSIPMVFLPTSQTFQEVSSDD